MKFIIATNNAKKLVELERILKPLGIEAVSARDAGVVLGEVEETGTTFLENALIKANAAYQKTGMPAVADDSGICVDALDGRPGIFSARWAGEHGDDAANNAKLLAQMADVADDARTARFHSSVVLVTRDEDGEEVLSGEGDCEGTIARYLRGTNGFGYDPLFELADLPGLRMAELAPDQKNAISHRRRALDDLVRKLG